MIKIIAVLCNLASPANCHEQTVTTSDFADVSMQSCLMGAPQLAEWMNHPAERLAGMALRDGQAGWQGRLAEGGKRGRMSEAKSAFRLCLSPHIRFAHAGYLPRVYVAF